MTNTRHALLLRLLSLLSASVILMSAAAGCAASRWVYRGEGTQINRLANHSDIPASLRTFAAERGWEIRLAGHSFRRSRNILERLQTAACLTGPSPDLFIVAAGSRKNAGTLPGRGIFIFEALVTASGDAELAAVLAHELAHFALSERTSSGLVRELEADRFAVQLIARAGYDPELALRLWAPKGIVASSDDHGGGKSHPRAELRLAHLRQSLPQALKEYRGHGASLGAGTDCRQGSASTGP